MNIKDDGGPAFPEDFQRTGQQGISLRDYFAAAALQGMLVGDSDEKLIAWEDPYQAAEWAYEFADAMLKVRNEPK